MLYRVEVQVYLQERFELLVEPAEDTKVLVAWNTDTIVLAFRGTASMTNVLSDLQVAEPEAISRNIFFSVSTAAG